MIAALATRQHGVISTGQLTDLGLSRSGVSRRVRQGRLHRVHRGVYAVGHPLLSAAGARMAAVLASGPSAVLSHTSAAATWDLLADRRSTIHVIVCHPNGSRGRSGVTTHRMPGLDSSERTLLDGLPVTTVARTLVDVGDVCAPKLVRRAFIAAEQGRLLDMRAVEVALGRARGRRGARLLAEILECYDPRWQQTRSELELMMLDALAANDLPAPSVNQWIASRFMVDFLWRDRALIVETDGGQVHGTATARRDDARRDRVLSHLGYRVMRFPYHQVKAAPEAVVASVVAAVTNGP